MTPNYVRHQNNMALAARALHNFADAVVNELEGTPILDADTADGDAARAAYENARRWRALVEGGIS